MDAKGTFSKGTSVVVRKGDSSYVAKVLKTPGAGSTLIELEKKDGRKITAFLKDVEKQEWHGCTNSKGHYFSEGICDDCGLDLRTPEQKAEQESEDGR